MNSQAFFNLFKLTENTDYIRSYIWNTDRNEIGFSIVKKYPENKKFIPAKTKDGHDDTVILLKVYLNNNNIDNKTNRVPVELTIAKASNYYLINPDRFGIDFNDPLSPTQESLDISKRSPQPIDLSEPNRFELDLSNNTFFDKDKKTLTTPLNIINSIYDEHIKTYASVKGSLLKAKISFNNHLIKLLEFFGKMLVRLIPPIAGRNIENNSYNLLLEPFYYSNNPNRIKDDTENDTYIEYDNLIKKINPFLASITASLILILYIVDYLCINIFGVINFIRHNSGDQVFSVVVVTFVILLMNYIIPNFMLFVLNLNIHILNKLRWMKFKI